MAGQLITVSKQGSPASSAQLQGTVTEGWVVTARTWATDSQGRRPSPTLAREGKQGPGQILRVLEEEPSPGVACLPYWGPLTFTTPCSPPAVALKELYALAYLEGVVC